MIRFDQSGVLDSILFFAVMIMFALVWSGFGWVLVGFDCVFNSVW